MDTESGQPGKDRFGRQKKAAMKLSVAGSLSKPGRRGVALVLVLGFLVLVTALILAFFASVTTEFSSARSYANGLTARTLADSAVSTVIGIIRTATSRDPKVAWASQPGMIRTYYKSGSSYTGGGDPLAYYKLYSSGEMELTATQVPKFDLANELDTQWLKKPSLFTDINAPVLISGSAVFPIIDGNQIHRTMVSGSHAWSYASGPGGTPLVEGFSIDPKSITYNDTLPLSTSNTPVPMPVKWIYVLRDGTLTTPNEVNEAGTTIRWTNPAVRYKWPSTTNPIIGRIAFWTDDETSKINVNTASEGVFWDRPWTFNNEDLNQFAARIPAQNEFQHIPGHPATTCLSPVLGSLIARPGTVDAIPATLSADSYNTTLKRYYDLLPRIQDGGTCGGTVPAANPVSLDSQRLFSSVDEMLFPATGQRITNPVWPSSPQTLLKRAGFFLTTSSRAPELNLFSRPRVSLWPLQTGSNARNAKDHLLAFCSTLGTGTNASRYYFQRLNAYAGAEASGSPSSQSTTDDWTIQRNQDLYSYLQDLLKTEIPGFGGKFRGGGPSSTTSQSKYTSGASDQILTEMIDVIRSCVNNSRVSNVSPSYDYAVPADAPGMSTVVPLRPPAKTPGANTKGFGTFSPTVCEADLVFFRTTGSGGTPHIGAFLCLNLFLPYTSPPNLCPSARIVVRGLDKLSIALNGSTGTFGLPASAVNRISMVKWGPPYNFYSAGSLWDSNAHQKTPGTSNEDANYPFITPSSSGVPIGNATTFTMNSVNITVDIYPCSPNLAPGSCLNTNFSGLLQTATISFLRTTGLQVPTVSSARGNQDIPTYLTSSSHGNTNAFTTLVDPNADSCVGMQVATGAPAYGDLRSMCALGTISSSYFTPAPAINSHFSSSMRFRDYDVSFLGGSKTKGGYQWGIPNSIPRPVNLKANLVSGLETFVPGAVPAGTDGVTMGALGIPGDWDNGVGDHADGPNINNIDAGSSVGATSNSGFSAYYGNNQQFTSQNVDYCPSRQIPSAVVFGSLPTGVIPTGALTGAAASGTISTPWCTLLFCKNPAAGHQHPGFGLTKNRIAGNADADSGPPYVIPPDHLLLDLFTMPVVEPYAISEPFSTAGKINLNYQIVPFTYITRSTGIRGVMKAVKVTAIPGDPATAMTYKRGGSSFTQPNSLPSFRYPINIDETLKGFDQRFNPTKYGLNALPDLFRSATEICTLYFVPKNETYEQMQGNWWTKTANCGLTGDNVREIPYGMIYPRVTTKSNSYCVHVRAQTLRPLQGQSIVTGSNESAMWKESNDSVLSEYRGSTLIERYIDPEDPNLPDFATIPSSNPRGNMDRYYKFRVVYTRKF